MLFLRSLSLLLVLTLSFSLNAQNSLPDVDAKTLDGTTVNLLEAYGGESGKITVISFWATWCSPCKKELDAIMDFYPDWQENYNVEVVAITIDDQRSLAKVGPIVQTKGWEYTILHGDEQLMRNAFNFVTIPQTFVVDQNGIIVYTHNGYVPGDEDELDDKLAELAGK